MALFQESENDEIYYRRRKCRNIFVDFVFHNDLITPFSRKMYSQIMNKFMNKFNRNKVFGPNDLPKFLKKLPIGPLRLEKKFARFFRSSVVQNGRFRKTLAKFFFFEPKGHFGSFFRKNFLSTMTSGKFQVDPTKILSP